jgi:putative endonuclease
MSRSTDAQRLGRAWETRAAVFLADQGFDILQQGYRCRLGELDIVGSDGAGLVIVEVRARSKSEKGSAIETIGHRKRRRIVNATRHFLMKNPHWHARPIRFDVVAIDGIETDQPEIQWIRNAFDAS